MAPDQPQLRENRQQAQKREGARKVRVEEPSDVPVPNDSWSVLGEHSEEEREEERAEENLDLLAGGLASSGSGSRVKRADGEGGGGTGEEGKG